MFNKRPLSKKGISRLMAAPKKESVWVKVCVLERIHEREPSDERLFEKRR
jgi:hypothetical protein